MSNTRSSSKSKGNTALEETSNGQDTPQCYDKETLEKSLESLFDKKLGPLSAKVEEVLDSIQFLSAQYDEIVGKVNLLEEKTGKLETENQELKSHISYLSDQLLQQGDVINDMDQYSRRDCLEIHGIPLTSDEDTDNIVQKIGNLTNVVIKPEDISVSHRLRANNRTGMPSHPPPIIVKFVRRNIKEKLYWSRKNLQGKLTTDLGLTRSVGNKIYINECLTSRNKHLFKQCLNLKKESNYKFIWTVSGKIFIRKDSNSPAVQIQNQRDLDIISGS